MTRKEFIKMMSKDTKKRMALTKKKGEDYAGRNILSNFKRVGLVIDVLRSNELRGRYSYALSLILLKIDRIVNLMLRETPPQNESLNDTFMDLKNYVDLLHALYRECG